MDKITRAKDLYAQGLDAIAIGKIDLCSNLIQEAISLDPRFLRINRVDEVDSQMYESITDVSTIKSHWVMYRLGLLMLDRRTPHTAYEYFERAFFLIEEDTLAFKGFRDLYLNLAMLSLLEDNSNLHRSAVSREVHSFSSGTEGTHWKSLVEAALAMVENDEEKSFAKLVEIRAFFDKRRHLVHKLQMPYETVLTTDEIEGIDRGNVSDSDRLHYDVNLGLLPQDGTAHLVAADVKYFTKFAPAFLRSARSSQITIPIIFHIVGLDTASEDLAVKLFDEYRDLQLSFTSSALPSGVNERAYYASARFFLAQELMSKSELSLLISDIDVTVVGSSSELLSCMGDSEIAVRIRPNRNYYPWKKVIVNLMVLKHSQTSREVLSLANRYARAVIFDPKRKSIWGVDQTAFCYAIMKARAQGAEVCDLNKFDYRYVRFAGRDKLSWASSIMEKVE